jgi:hypothetical protein
MQAVWSMLIVIAALRFGSTDVMHRQIAVPDAF